LSEALEPIKTAVRENDLDEARILLADARIAEQINDGWFEFGRPPLVVAPSTEMADLLMDMGADLAKLSAWWAPGFWLYQTRTEVAEHLVARGANLSAHAASALGMVGHLSSLLEDEPALVNAAGGDGGRPLHFARNVLIAQALIDRGATLDPRDEDHRSTPAQWHVGERPEVTRLLLQGGAEPDIFLAVGLGDMDLVEQAVSTNPACTGYRIGNNMGPYPGIGFEGTGGSILQWSLGFNASPHEIALKHGHQDIFDRLITRTAPRPKLMVACMVGDEFMAQSILRDHPDIIDQFDADDHSLLARASWETNHNNEAVRIMLDLGFPIDSPEPNHGFDALHNAAFDGNTELVKLLIDRGHPIDVPDPENNGTPLGWCIHAATEARGSDHDYAGVVRLLLRAGASFDNSRYPVGHTLIDTALKDCLGL
jgi:hypothetical protein